MNDSLRDDLIRLSREINADPELAYKEERAVGRITALLQKHGHEVERNLGGLPTAFRARVGPSRSSLSTTPSRTSGTAAATTSSR